jgi:putative phosphonate metabolism protein
VRYAIYFTPPPDHPLTATAAAWLGRDPFTGHLVPPGPVAGLSAAECAFHTAAARRYGFHATLKAPFRLAPGQTEQALFAAFDAFAGAVEPVRLDRVTLGRIDGFFALLPGQRADGLNRLADDAVIAFEPFRAALTDEEIERRNPDALAAREFRNLHQWGYPFVFEAFRFHMTLSGRVDETEAPRLEAAIRETFSAFIDQPLDIAAIALLVEPEPGAPFAVHRFARLGVSPERKSA